MSSTKPFIEEAIVQLLSQSPEYVALIGDKFFPLYAPQGTHLPYIAYLMSSGNSSQNMDGTGGYREDVIRFQIYSESYFQVKTIGRICTEQLNGFKGIITVGNRSLRVDGIYRESNTTNHITPSSGDGVGYMRGQQDYKVTSEESVNTF